jgi:hypothetical protein
MIKVKERFLLGDACCGNAAHPVHSVVPQVLAHIGDKFQVRRPSTPRNFVRSDDPLHDSHNTANMGRLHSKGKGIASSAIPYSRAPPAWLKTTPEQVVDQICKLARKGATPSQIGVVLRDSHGVAQVKVVTGTQ